MRASRGDFIMIHYKNYHIRFCLLFAAGLLLGGCSKEDELKKRPFLMGFRPFPYEISQVGIEYTYDKLAAEADIINHHFDNGVPWEEALNGESFPTHIMDDWTYRLSKADVRQKTYVSVTPINFSRDGLAAYRGTEDNMPLPAPWNTYGFNHENVKTAYLNYCKRVIDFFEPDYFGMSIETNLLYLHNPGLWAQYLKLHEHTYHSLKLLYPDLPVFSSVAGAPLLKGFLEGNDHVQQRLAVMQLLELSDYYAISFYPHLTGFGGNPYPDNTFDELFSISPKPLIIAETGYTAETFSMNNGHGLITIQTDPVKQQLFLDDLLAASDEWRATFVIYSTLRDYDQHWKQIGSPHDINIAWRDAGLYDEAGNPRPALNSWRGWYKRRVDGGI
jgi:hypothetical protein